ncbi:MAG: hypothetical protein KME31_21705 [Tolypothrix carrinoi HA7290-LM1]|nr:hypothetical protein [Tolypothrix carrinoi HA7290-LM1]
MSWTCVDGQVRVVAYSTVDVGRGDTVEHSLLERYLPRLQGYGDGVEIFAFNKNVPLQGKVLFESEHSFGVRTQSACAERLKDSIPRGWYDRDFKVVIRYSKELVPM